MRLQASGSQFNLSAISTVSVHREVNYRNTTHSCYVIVSRWQMLRIQMTANGAWLGSMHATTQGLPTNTRSPLLLVPFPELVARLRAASPRGQPVGIQKNRQHTRSRNSQVPIVHRKLSDNIHDASFVLGKGRERRKKV